MRPEPSRTGTGAAHRAPLPLAWWGGHGDRLLFILRPPAPVRDAVIQSLEHAGMLDLLGDHWPVECWHQLVSARYEDTPEIRQRLLQAGARVQADTFRIELDRVRVTADGHAQSQNPSPKGTPRLASHSAGTWVARPKLVSGWVSKDGSIHASTPTLSSSKTE